MAKRHSRREWQRIVAAWKESGLPIREYCEQRGLKPRTFGWWRWQFEQTKKQKAVAPKRRPEKRTKKANGKPAFVEVAIKQPIATARSADLEVRIGERTTIRVPRGFDRETFVEVLDLLETRRC